MQIGEHNNRYGKKGMRNVSGVTNVVRNFNVDQKYFTLSANGGGIFLGVRPGAKAVPSINSFACTVEGITCTILEGTVRVHNHGNYEYTGGTVTLGGDPCWVYIEWVRGSTTITAGVSTSEPTTTTTVIQVPLIKCELSGASSYTKVRTCWEQDVQIFESPIM
jgi:hypothetical protein